MRRPHSKTLTDNAASRCLRYTLYPVTKDTPMDDSTLLRELASLFYVTPDGTVEWMWEPRSVACAGSVELQDALRTYREKNGITNLI